MKNSLLLFAFAVLLAACNTEEYNEHSLIEMKKDPCFGFCPVYAFRVNGKGNARFDGERNVSKEGTWERTLSQAETKALFDAFVKSNFDDFDDEYTDMVTDLPTTWLTFRHGGINKTVKDYYGAPESLRALEQLVEAIAETDEGWVKTSENPGH